MITLQQAIDLATEAHEGQWRKPIELHYSDVQKLTNLESIPNKHEQTFSDGSKLVWEDLNEEWLYYVPYITHPLTVMNMMNTDEEKIVAVLHDILEDTEATLNHISAKLFYIYYKDKQYLINKEVYCALERLTKPKISRPYQEYIILISKNKLATKVKLADIIHNLSCTPSEHAKQKYLKSVPILLAAL